MSTFGLETNPAHQLTRAGSTNPVRDSFAQLDQAEQLRQAGKLDKARTICEGLIHQHPDYFGALHTLGLILADQHKYQRAAEYFHRAVMLHPRSWTTLTALAGVYLRLDANEMAIQSLEVANDIKPSDANILVTLGEVYREEREYERSKEAYRNALEVEPNLVAAAVGYGWACEDLGEYQETAKVFQDLIQRGLHFLEPVQALTGLPSSYVKLDVLAELDKVARDARENKTDFEIDASFTRAAALDKARRYNEAWPCLVEANRLVAPKMRERLKTSKLRQTASLARLRQVVPSGLRVSAADDQRFSLFILGPSRSGKTTVERLIGTLEGVKRGYENPCVENALRRTFQTAGLLTSNLFENLPPQLYPLCRELYVDELARRAGSAKVFTNTHPLRIHDAAAMLAALPNVRFLLVKRDPMDNALRIYMRKYRTGNAYAYDLLSIRGHIEWYHQMIDALADKFPQLVRILRYEDMVQNPKLALQAVADLTGLAIPSGSIAPIGNDGGCSEPYAAMIASELN